MLITRQIHIFGNYGILMEPVLKELMPFFEEKNNILNWITRYLSH
jgi:hypothetical protein